MNTTMITRRIPVDMLKPAKYNPRVDLQPGDPAYEKIKKSLDMMIQAFFFALLYPIFTSRAKKRTPLSVSLQDSYRLITI